MRDVHDAEDRRMQVIPERMRQVPGYRLQVQFQSERTRKRMMLRNRVSSIYGQASHGENRPIGNPPDIARSYESREIDWHKELGVDKSIPIGNMSCCMIGGDRLLVSVRQFNYRMGAPKESQWTAGGFWNGRANHFAIADMDFNFVKKVECDRMEMIEDLRIVPYGDVVQASGTDISFGRKKCKIAVFDIDAGSMAVKSKTYFDFVRQKNFMPVEDGKGVFVSDIGNGQIDIAEIRNPAKKTRQSCLGIIPYSGSTQLVRHEDGYVCVIHRHVKRQYVNAFAFFDRKLLTCRISDEFAVFSDVSPVSFCCGMSICGDTAVIPFCVNDGETHLFRLPLEDFRKTARMRS